MSFLRIKDEGAKRVVRRFVHQKVIQFEETNCRMPGSVGVGWVIAAYMMPVDAIVIGEAPLDPCSSTTIKGRKSYHQLDNSLSAYCVMIEDYQYYLPEGYINTELMLPGPTESLLKKIKNWLCI